MKCSYLFSVATAVLAVLGTSIASRAADVPVTTTNKWESSAAAGATLTRGNSKTFLGTLSIGTGKKWNQNELAFGADAAYGTTEETRTTVVDPGPPPITTKKDVTTTTAQSARAFGQYNRLFTERFYGYARIEGLHDEVADITYRLSLSPGVGYYFFKSKPTELSAEIGPGYIYQKLGHETDSYATLRLAEKFKQELSDRARVWQSVEFLPQVDKFKNYIINFEVGVEADLSASKKFALRVYLDDTYNNVPANGRKANDLKLVAALACKF